MDADGLKLREALDKAAYALFQVKRLVDAGPVTRDFVRVAYDEAVAVLNDIPKDPE